MKNPTIEILNSALELHQAGTPIKAILEATGLNYSQAWYFIRSAELREAGYEFPEFTVKACAAMREEGLSWGEIAVRFQKPESQIRKAWTEATGLKSQGQRIGKGGRFFYGDRGAPLYAEALKAPGTDIPKGAHYGEAIEAAEQENGLLKQDITELRALATEKGIRFSKKATKAQLVRKIRAAELATA